MVPVHSQTPLPSPPSSLNWNLNSLVRSKSQHMVSSVFSWHLKLWLVLAPLAGSLSIGEGSEGGMEGGVLRTERR